MDAQTDASQSYASDVAFSPSVKAIQTRKGSRASYHKQEERGWRTQITADLAEFIAAQTSFMLATASADGQPYIQHRGGPAGFLRVLDEQDAGVRGFRRQPAIHHAGQSRRECEGLHLHHRLSEPPADQALGHRARGRERSRAAREADAGRLSRRGPSRSSCSRCRSGTPTARSTFRRSSTLPMSCRSSPSATSASPSSRRKSRG